MSKTLTPKIKLVSESDDEIIDQFPDNWPILDTYAGAIQVAAGASPPNMYDGMVVWEPTTGISWIAKQSGDTFSKKWLTYPWTLRASKSSFSAQATTGLWIRYNLDAVDASQCLNSSVADLVGGNIKVPVDGIYEFTAGVQWGIDGEAFNNSYRQVCFGDGTVSGNWSGSGFDLKFVNGYFVNNNFSMTFKLTAGTVVGAYLYNSMNTTKVVNVMYVSVSLLSPL